MSAMRLTCRLGACLVASLCASAVATSNAFAQSSELYDPGQYLIDGMAPACSEFETLVTDEGPELIHPDGITIVINGPVFDALPTEIKLFVYHETCNLISFGVREDVVQLADMLTVRLGLAQGWMTAPVAEAICETDMLAEAGWTMAPDADRCAAIYDIMRAAFE